MRAKNKNNRRAMTLMELVLVATIFALIAAGIAASFVLGLKVWGRAKDSGLSKYGTELLFASILKEVRQNLGTGLTELSGTSTEFSFSCILKDSPLKVTYAFSSADRILVRRSVLIKDMLAGKESNSSQERKLISLDDFEVSYFYFDKDQDQFLWKQDWSQQQSGLNGVKLHAVYKGKDFYASVFCPQP